MSWYVKGSSLLVASALAHLPSLRHELVTGRGILPHLNNLPNEEVQEEGEGNDYT